MRPPAVAGTDITLKSRELGPVGDLRGRTGIQTALERALTRLGDRLDIVLIDCAPNLGLLAVHAPDGSGRDARSRRDARRRSDRAQRPNAHGRKTRANLRSPPALEIDAIVVTRCIGTKESKDCVDQMRQAFPDAMLQTVVRESARLGGAFTYARPIAEARPGREWVQPLTAPSRRSCRVVESASLLPCG